MNRIVCANCDAEATQEFLEIKDIKEGVLILKNNSIRGILMVSSTNFALKSVCNLLLRGIKPVLAHHNNNAKALLPIIQGRKKRLQVTPLANMGITSVCAAILLVKKITAMKRLITKFEITTDDLNLQL